MKRKIRKLKVRLIEGWKDSWKFWSTQLAVLATILQAVGMYLNEVQVWTSLASFILILLVPVVRVIDQKVQQND